jgi:hypothetical protein
MQTTYRTPLAAPLAVLCGLALIVGQFVAIAGCQAQGVAQAYPPMTTQGYTAPSNGFNPYNNAGPNRMVRFAPLSQSSLPAITGNSNYAADSQMGLRGRVSLIPKGAMMMVRLDQPISSYNSNLGDPITATLENDLFVNDQVAIPAGSIIQGQVSNVAKSGRLGRSGDLDVRFFSARTPDGMVVPLRAHVVTNDDTGVLKGDKPLTTVGKGVGYALGGTAVGTVAGLSAGSLLGSVGTGTLFGLGAGSLFGLGYAVMRQGKDVVLPSGSRLSLMADQTSAVAP